MTEKQTKASPGCEFGRTNRLKIDDTNKEVDEVKINVNSIGAKLDGINKLLIATLTTMLGSILVGIIVFYVTKGR